MLKIENSKEGQVYHFEFKPEIKAFYQKSPRLKRKIVYIPKSGITTSLNRIKR